MCNKKSLCKVLCVVMAALMSVCALSGCGGKKSSNNITYWCSMDSNASTVLQNYNDLEIYDVLEKKHGINIDFLHPVANQSTEQFNLKVASNSLDDIMEYNWLGYAGGPEQAIRDGLIIPLNEYIENGHAPNLKKIMDENPEIAKQLKTDDGTIYAMPCIGLNAISVTTGFIMRGDWLDKLGLERPETIAELENVLTQFKDKLGAVAPFTGVGNNVINNAPLCGAFGCSTGFYLKDGKVAYGPLEEGYRQYVQTMRDWYAKGLIDVDIFGNNSKTIQSNIINNKSGFTSGGVGGTMGTITTAARQSNPDFKLVAIDFPVLEKGQINAFAPRAWEVRASSMAAITPTNPNPEKSVEFLDSFYGDEGVLLKNFGIEGKTYTMVNGVPTYTDEILNNPDGLSLAQALGKYTRATQPSPGLIHRAYYDGYYQLEEQLEAIEMWNKNADAALKTTIPQVTPNMEEADELARIKTGLTTYVEEQTTLFVLGKKDMSEFDAFIKELKSLDVDKAIKIYQTTYDRYLKR